MDKWTAASDEPKELSMALPSVAASRQSAALCQFAGKITHGFAGENHPPLR
jgi:hypothetical protein